MWLVGISVFPVKSARGIDVPAAQIEARGLVGDRRWVLADGRGRFVSQRELPALARLDVEITAGGLRLAHAGEVIEVPVPDRDVPRTPVTIWNDTLPLAEAPSAAPWLSRHFNTPLRLFHQPDDARREVAAWGQPGDQVSLADAFPALLATTASLDRLRSEAGEAIVMNRFRPNLVIDGASAWEEDGWERIQIGDVQLDLVKPCTRCTVTTVDQGRGEFAGDEPLDALRRLRMSGDRRVAGVLFGWNAVPRRLGMLRVGDLVTVVSTRTPWPIRPERAGSAGAAP